MNKVGIGALLIAGLMMGADTLHGQEWARKMFGENTHDFGIVAAGSEAVHRFEFQNIYQEDLHVVSVRSSCGCTSATIEKQDVKTFEKSAIIARFNTVSFRDQKQATLTVTIDRPYPAEVQLIVRGNIRGNVAFEPGSVQFGDIVAGNPVNRSIRVVQRGTTNWSITDVKTTFDASKIRVRLNETGRSNALVTYDLDVELQEDVPEGYVSGELFIETNEGLRYPLRFHGRVTAPLKIGPEVLTMGPIGPGEVVKRRVLLRADTPFRVTSIDSPDNRLVLRASDKKNKLHVIDVTYTAGAEPGIHDCRAEIMTDLGTRMQASLHAIAIVEVDPLKPIVDSRKSEPVVNNFEH